MAKMKSGSDAEKSVNKMGLVRAALQELGDKAKPKAISAHVMTKHGVEISATMISSYKSNILGGSGRSAGGPRGRGGDVSVSLTDVENVQRLIDRVGANKLQHLIRLLAK